MHSKMYKNTGYLLFTARKAIRKTRKECFAELGFAKIGNMSKYESGKLNPPMNRLLDFCKVYEIDKTALFDSLCLDYKTNLEAYKGKLMEYLGVEKVTLGEDSACNFYEGC